MVEQKCFPPKVGKDSLRASTLGPTNDKKRGKGSKKEKLVDEGFGRAIRYTLPYVISKHKTILGINLLLKN
jgi:hypothetical protein